VELVRYVRGYGERMRGRERESGLTGEQNHCEPSLGCQAAFGVGN